MELLETQNYREIDQWDWWECKDICIQLRYILKLLSDHLKHRIKQTKNWGMILG